jgi:hypothetical protein
MKKITKLNSPIKDIWNEMYYSRKKQLAIWIFMTIILPFLFL